MSSKAMFPGKKRDFGGDKHRIFTYDLDVDFGGD
jgi:hypothetical protein